MFLLQWIGFGSTVAAESPPVWASALDEVRRESAAARAEVRRLLLEAVAQDAANRTALRAERDALCTEIDGLPFDVDESPIVVATALVWR